MKDASGSTQSLEDRLGLENGGGRAEGDSRMDTRTEPERGAGLEGAKWGLEGV